MTKAQFEKSIAAIFKKRRKELLAKLSRLENRRKEGWGYKRIYRKRHKVPEYWVGGHYAMVPVKRR